MSKINKLISIFITCIFLQNALIIDTSLTTPVVENLSLFKLAAGSIFSELNGTEAKEIGLIELALEANLMNRGVDELDPKALINEKEFLIGENTVFDPVNMHFFLHETKELPNGYLAVMCRVRATNRLDMERGSLLRTYYAVFPKTKDARGGFPVETFTEVEFKRWMDSQNVFGGSVRGRDRTGISRLDGQAVNRYKQHEDEIDKFISERIKAGDFAEIEERRGKLGWGAGEKVFEGVTGAKYWPQNLWGILQFEMNSFLKFFKTDLERALEGKNLVFVRVPKNVPYPVIYENGQAITVKGHASNNAVYIFLEESVFDLYDNFADAYADPGEPDGDTMGVIPVPYLGFIKETLVHEIGVIHGLKYIVNWGEILNGLDIAYVAYKQSAGKESIADETVAALLKAYPDLEKLNNEKPVDLEAILKTRDYSAGDTENAHTPLVAKPLNDIALKDIARIKMALRSLLDNMITIRVGNVLMLPDFKQYCTGKTLNEITIFSPVKISFYDAAFVTPAENKNGNGEIILRCDIKGETEGVRSYFVIFDNGLTQTDEKKVEFPIKGVYTQEEYTQHGHLVSTRPERLPEDSETIDRYVQHEEKIDSFVRERIRANDFVELENISSAGERWSIPGLKTPQEYWSPLILDLIRERLDPFLKNFGTNLDKALKGKELVIIKVPAESSDPVIKEAGHEITVRSHASHNAIYVFLDEGTYYDMGRIGPDTLYQAKTESNIGTLAWRLVHEIGVIHGLPYKLGPITVRNNTWMEIRNSLDRAYGVFVHKLMKKQREAADPADIISLLSSKKSEKVVIPDDVFNEEDVAKLLRDNPSLSRLKDGPLDLSGVVRDRDYAGGEKVRGSETAKTQSSDDTKEWLERLEEIADEGTLMEDEAIAREALLNAGVDKARQRERLKAIAEISNSFEARARARAALLTNGVDGNLQIKELMFIANEYRFSRPGIIAQGELLSAGYGTGEKIKELKSIADRYLTYRPAQHVDYGIEVMARAILLEHGIDHKTNIERMNFLFRAAGQLGHNTEILARTAIYMHDPDIRVKMTQAGALKRVLAKGEAGKAMNAFIISAFMRDVDMWRAVRDEERRENEKKELEDMVSLANEVGVKIAPPAQKYTLITLGNMYKDREEFERDKIEYGSRFGLERVMTDGMARITIIDRILGIIRDKGLDPNDVIVQLPPEFSEEKNRCQAKILLAAAPGIRFLAMDTLGLKDEKERKSIRRNLYAIMLLARAMDESVRKDSGLYRLLAYFVNVHMRYVGKGEIKDKGKYAEEYVAALVENNIMKILSTLLMYKPMDKYDLPSYDRIAATLISA